MASVSSLFLCFQVNPEPTWVKHLLSVPLLGELLTLSTNIRQRLPRNKHSSLLGTLKNYGHKRFHNFDQGYKTLFFSLSSSLQQNKLECWSLEWIFRIMKHVRATPEAYPRVGYWKLLHPGRSPGIWPTWNILPSTNTLAYFLEV